MFDNKFSQNIYNKITYLVGNFLPQIVTLGVIGLIFSFHKFISKSPPEKFTDYTLYIQLFLIGFLLPILINYISRKKRIKELKSILFYNRNVFSKRASRENWKSIIELNELKPKSERIFLHQIELGKGAEIFGKEILDTLNLEYNWHMKKHGRKTYKSTNAVFGYTVGEEFKEISIGDKYDLHGFDFSFLNITNIKMRFIDFKDCTMTAVRFYESDLSNISINDENQNVGMDKYTKDNSAPNRGKFYELIQKTFEAK